MHSLTIAANILKRTIGQPKGFLMLVLLPALVLSGIVLLFGTSVESPRVIALWNADEGPLGAALVSSLEEMGGYQLQNNLGSNAGELRSAVTDSRADAAVYIPPDYTASLLDGKLPEVKLYRLSEQLWNAALEQRLSSEAGQAAKYARLSALHSEEGPKRAAMLKQLLAETNNRPAALSITPLNEDGSTGSRNVLITGVILMFLMMAINGAIQVVMEDREQRTMSRMFAAPIRSYSIAAGNFIGSLLVGTIQLLLMLIVTEWIFQYDYGVDFLPHFIVLECFLLAAVGIATAVAGLVSNVNQLSQIQNLIVTPSCLLGGCFVPIGMMPPYIQKLANFMPQKWALEAIGKLAFGNALRDVLLPLGILLLFAAVLLAFGSVVLQPSKKTV
ncbi:ABC transporter permease [Paenibacillus oenotherae]|uniref:ABC transporter permease n=1 Tax=Paenibacillus oenotherae TaxID=1435645 RepID=A0ABS7D117_9BACL|nr:ABC transporter permease [Paenibacillus oenotherae]MBW7473583.1 ABC transporter permease [Paenibacillus oenotherae]